jgi:predicted metalloprotease
VGPASPGQDQFAHCTTAEAANTDVDCRIIATAESLDAVWAVRLPEATGVEYVPPGLQIFQGQTSTACGGATSATGPFYCPPDATVYIDSSFFDVLTQQFGASGGPLAQEYVVAHEFGHHIQNQLGVLGASQQDPDGADSGAVRVELQADCYAGIWAHDAASSVDPETGVTFLEPLTDADIADALSAASAVGDDRIQAKTQGRVDPEAWTHGSSAQRQLWFTTG